MNDRTENFSRSRRLLRPEQFEAVLKRPAWKRERHSIRLFAVPNTGKSPRVGIVTPKRAIRKAHDRNRAKRRIRETFRRACSELPCVDMVIMVGSAYDPTRINEVVTSLFEDLCRKFA